MTVELMPKGVSCNLSCSYCYQNPMREAENTGDDGYSIDAMLETVDEADQRFTLFGGEPLLLPKDDLEELWAYGYDEYERNSLQTNGVLIDDDHIRMFKDYNVGVGISIDGPGELNDLRWGGTLEKTRKSTAKAVKNIERLVQEGIGVSIIITIHRANASTDDRLNRLKDFMKWLEDLGVLSGNIHALEEDSEIMSEKYALKEKRHAEVFVELAKFTGEHSKMEWKPFTDVADLLRADDQNVNCTWMSCDPLTTSAVQGIQGDGSLANCGRTNKEGINWYKADKKGFERYLSLYQTPQDQGGCKDCRFFLMCGGQCPGEGEQGDWRNKTEHCHTMKELFRYYEDKFEQVGITPLSKSPIRDDLEQFFMDKFKRGEKPTIQQGMQVVQGNGQNGASNQNASNTDWSERPDHVDGVQHVDGAQMHGDSDDPPVVKGTVPVESGTDGSDE